MSFTIFCSGKTPFQATKTRSSKSGKMYIFPKGLTHGFGPKMAVFPIFFFWEIYAGKMSFTISQSEKTHFQAIKTSSPKSRKIDLSLKGLTHGFGPKMAIFPTFIFGQYRPGKCLLRCSRAKGRLSRLQKQDDQKVEKKGLTHGFGPKMAMFPTFIFGQYRRGKCVLRYSRAKRRLSRL